MYRVYVLQRPGGQRHIDCSQNVLSSMKSLNRQLERKGKKRRDFWRLIWFGESLDLNESRKLCSKMQRLVRNPSSLRKMMQDNMEKKECELTAEELPDS